MDWQQVWQTVQNWLTNTGIKIVIAIAIMVVSFHLSTGFVRKSQSVRIKRSQRTRKLTKPFTKPSVTS